MDCSSKYKESCCIFSLIKSSLYFSFVPMSQLIALFGVFLAQVDLFCLHTKLDIRTLLQRQRILRMRLISISLLSRSGCSFSRNQRDFWAFDCFRIAFLCHLRFSQTIIPRTISEVAFVICLSFRQGCALFLKLII